jgi:hypothetical protein
LRRIVKYEVAGTLVQVPSGLGLSGAVRGLPAG